MKFVFDKAKCLPFTLTLGIIALDQLVKLFIVKNWPEGTFIKDLFDNDLVRFIHVRNKAIAFSLGQNLPEFLRTPFFVILPIVVLGLLLWYYFKTPSLCTSHRWAIAGIVGGGIGNIIDRIFRPDGVVDYVSVKFFGIFGWDYWPTFNIADASVVISCLILLAVMIFGPKTEEENEVS
ncbi:MAG: signal peptidase II [Treponema sp.]|jgi:signal peptidase II|nr:signal peptidase II [Treponema sp.]